MASLNSASLLLQSRSCLHHRDLQLPEESLATEKSLWLGQKRDTMARDSRKPAAWLPTAWCLSLGKGLGCWSRIPTWSWQLRWLCSTLSHERHLTPSGYGLCSSASHLTTTGEAWLDSFSCLVSITAMPWASSSWYTFILQGPNFSARKPWPRQSPGLQPYSKLGSRYAARQSYIHTVNEFLNLKAYGAAIAYSVIHGPRTTTMKT